MPFIKIWIHLVWATKKRAPLLTKDIRQKFSYLHTSETTAN